MSKAPLIYYVEDDEHIRDLTAYALHQAGMDVRAFHDGDGLVERCAVEPPDAVLLDIMLPGDDGLVLLQALRGNAATENLPVMMLTAKGTEFDKVVGLDAGADDLAVGDLLDSIDVLVDGPFVESRKSLELKWCGSSNQRLIDVPATRRAGSVVEWQPTSFSLEKPSNW